MRVIDPGHVYDLDSLDGPRKEQLTFVKREGEGYPGNAGHHPGTNLQEVLRVCIDRVKYLNNQITDVRNLAVIAHLREALADLERRAAERHGRTLQLFYEDVENLPVCFHCGHIACKGECHR